MDFNLIQTLELFTYLPLARIAPLESAAVNGNGWHIPQMSKSLNAPLSINSTLPAPPSSAGVPSTVNCIKFIEGINDTINEKFMKICIQTLSQYIQPTKVESYKLYIKK